MKRTGIRIVLAAGILGIAAPGRVGGSDELPAPIARVDEIRAAHPLPSGESLATLELLRGAGMSAHLIQVRTRLRSQLHREHEETAYILEGRGVFVVGDRVYPVKAGSLMLIPKGVVHGFEAKEPTTVLAVFSPPFDPQDRVLVDREPVSP